MDKDEKAIKNVEEVKTQSVENESVKKDTGFIREYWSKDFDREQHNRTVNYLFEMKKELGYR